jgi:hypothetical protein
MRALIAHEKWDYYGEGEFLNAYIVKTLIEKGFELSISCFGKV